MLKLAPDTIDAVRFERLVEQGRAALAAGDAEAATGVFADGLALWRGPALADFVFERCAAGEAGRLEELRLAATEDSVDAALALGRHRALIAELDQLVASHPLRERLRAQQMLALYRSGRQAEALRTYQAGRRILGDELGIDPSPALKALESAILLQDSSLDWAPPQPSAAQPSFADRGVNGPGTLSETVTFLMAGVHESTRLWSEQPELARAVLARHEQILDDVCGIRGGAVSAAGEGDNTIVVFRQASAAVAAAVELIRAERDEDWPAGGSVRTRIALHTGEATIRNGRYHGVAVNRAMVLQASPTAARSSVRNRRPTSSATTCPTDPPCTTSGSAG